MYSVSLLNRFQAIHDTMKPYSKTGPLRLYKDTTVPNSSTIVHSAAVMYYNTISINLQGNHYKTNLRLIKIKVCFSTLLKRKKGRDLSKSIRK